MMKAKLMYRGQELSLWDFAEQYGMEQGNYDMGDSGSFTEGGRAMFDEQVRRGKLSLLCEAITECEVFVYQIYEELDWKASWRRWFKLKIFGTLEQLRSETLMRYPRSRTIFLKTNDRKLIHCMWIPSPYYDAESKDPEIGSDDAPTMIMCGPNAEYLE